MQDFLRSLEVLDVALFVRARQQSAEEEVGGGPDAGQAAADATQLRSELSAAQTAFDKLLATVPQPVLERSQSLIAGVKEKAQTAASDVHDDSAMQQEVEALLVQ